jgi:hypothetical protein
MKLTAPRLARLRSSLSHDGQFAQFVLMNKAGGNIAFTVPFSEYGSLMGAFQNTAADMARRLAANSAASDAQVAEGLSAPMPVTAIAMGSDANNGDALLWLESESGGVSLRLAPPVVEELRRVLDQHENECQARSAAE